MKVPCTVVTGFLGAGKTTLVRHVLAHAAGRRIAVIVNEFGTLGIDGDTLRGCGAPGCDDVPGWDVIELANGCLCCTVADEFIPAMQALLDRPVPPEHILIETSGLALPKPLLKAFGWPAIRSRVTVDGVIAVIDGPAVAAGRFANDPAASVPNGHDNPLSEVYRDQLHCADLVVLNKADLLDAASLARLRAEVAADMPRPVSLVAATAGRVDLAVLLGLDAAAEADLDARPSCHDADDEHEHDDFTSFTAPVAEAATPDALLDRLRAVASAHGILRVKGFAAVAGRPMRLAVQGVGARFSSSYDRPWGAEPRQGRMVVIGQAGLDQAAIVAALG